jgi:hypothetical protein
MGNLRSKYTDEEWDKLVKEAESNQLEVWIVAKTNIFVVYSREKRGEPGKYRGEFNSPADAMDLRDKILSGDE